MNTNQIMPGANKVNVSRKMTVSRGIERNKNGSFDDFMAKSKNQPKNQDKDSLTLQDVKDLAKNAEAAEKEAKLAEAAESVGKEANAPKKDEVGNKTEVKDSGQKDVKDAVKEMSEGTEISDTALAAQNAALFNALTKTVDSPSENDSATVDDTVKVDASASKLTLSIKTEITAEFTNLSSENSNEQNFNLRTILPQGDMGKNKEMLAMLSGQHIPRGEGKIDLNNFELVKPESVKPESVKNFETPAFMQEKPADPLSLMANEMAKIGKMAENKLNTAPELSNVPNVPLENVQDMPKTDMLGSKILDNFKNFVDNKEGSTLKDFGVTKDIPVDAKTSAGQEMPIKIQTTPINPQMMNTKTDNAQSNPIFSNINIEIEDTDVLPIRQFDNFNQNSNGDNEQSLFNKGQEEFPRPDNTTKAGEGRVESAPQFAHTLETQNQATATKESAPTTAQQLRDNFDVRGQIVEQARMIRAENGTEMVIRLKPEHLGEMTLRISVTSEGSVTASFFTNNSEVRHIVENSLVQLRQELQNQGLKVDKAEVYSGLSDGNLPQGNGQEAWQQNQSGQSSRNSSGEGYISAENSALEFENVSTETASSGGANNLAAEGVDYLV